MGFSLQVAGPAAIVSVVILSIIIVIRLTGFAMLQYGRRRYPEPHGRLNFPKEISVILTIRDPNDPNLLDYVRSILKNKPEQLFITTSDRKAQHRVEGKLTGLRFAYSATQISVGAVNEPSRRREIAHALASVSTPLTVLTDQGVHWSSRFLESALIPFADGRVGCVTVPMIARKRDGIWGSFWTRLFSCYYGLMAEKNRALNALDSSALFSGSPVLFRTKLAAQLRFKQQFEAEPCLNRWRGVHKADEYLFFNRYLLQEAVHEVPCLVVFQDTPDATVQADRRSIAEFLSEYLQMTRNLWRLSRVMIRQRERNQYPWAFLLTHLSSFASFTLIYDILFVLLVHFTIYLDDDEWIAWGTFGSLLLIFQTVVGAQIVRRITANNYGYDDCSTGTLLALLLVQLAYYVLEVLRLVALATAWKADVELISEADIKARAGDPEALRYHVNGAEEARTEINEPPWVSRCMELERPRRALRPLPDFPLFVIEE
ncbi:hypothetical protein BFJ63_vAg2225 [Fusarium oxysporum f. sp. narcissi]|uniref:Ceramide glucosyltransferase n=1 Tax=Fusarium oxysporum f. sp. narcissi TaxID=451672 RepID=A0A4Q2W7I4_FUSOX|nr:hypothetical protein BFJ63_vAg2225 [Fusarium oxysporum f. sp. narcissi]